MRSVVLAILAIGCGSSDPGERPRVFGGDRPTELDVPRTLDEGREYPLLLVLHGYSATGFIQKAYFQLSQLPDDNEALVLAPDGNQDSNGNQFWNADPVCCDFDGTDPDDVGYLSALLEDVIAAWPVDRSQVFVVGHSNGGFMGYRMACERADLITASALLAGNTSRPASACAPSEPTSMLIMHGTNDDAVPFDGIGNGIQLSAGAIESRDRWASYNGCGASTGGVALELEKTIDGDDETEVQVADCPSGIGVELWTHEGVGHLPAYNNTFGATLWSWFEDHARP